MIKKSLKINALLNVIKQLCQVLFPLISIPYITRVLQPDNYGKFNFGNSIVSYFVLLAALGISTYSVREGVAYRDNKEKFSEFASEIFSINVFSTVLSYTFLSLVLLHPAMSPYRKLILIQSLVIVLTTIGTDWINTIYEDYLYITIRYVIFQVITILLMFMFVHEPEDYLIYAVIVVGSSAGANILNFFHVRKYAKITLTFSIDWKRHLPPIMVFFANIFAITIYVNSDITMLGLLKSDKDVGIYTLSSKIYSVIKQILNAIIIVTIPRLAFLIKQGRKEEFDSLAIRIEKALLMLIFPATVGVAFLSDEIIAIVGGISYSEGAGTLIILSAAISFSLLATFYTSCIMIPLKMERYVLTATFISALTNVCLNLIFIPWLSFNGAAVTTLISECIVCLIGGYHSIKSGKKLIQMSFLIKIFLGSCVVGLTCFLLRSVQLHIIYRTILTVVTSSFLYFFVEIILRNELVIEETKLLLFSVKSNVWRK